MSTVTEKKAERLEIKNAYVEGKKPKRVFVTTSISGEAACGLAGIDLKQAHYKPELLEQALDKLVGTFPSDTMMGTHLRSAVVNQILGAKNWVMSSTGIVQHPEISPMSADEYDEFIENPYKMLVEKFAPRVYTALDTDPATSKINFMSAFIAWKNYNASQAAMGARISEKYGLVPGWVNNIGFVAPFDFLADQLRGFTQINMDIRRIPDKVKKAVDVITPMMMKKAIPTVMRPGLVSFIPFHMGTYISKKAFEELFWPSLEHCVVELDKMGIACCIFVEHDWTRYADVLATLPKSTIMYMEQGDPQVFANTVGKDHIFGGFYDPTISLTRSKEECIDEAKRLLDIGMKTGKFYFCFDKGIMDIRSIDVSKVVSVLEWVIQNGKY